MKKIFVDLETYSPVPLTTAGSYRYAEEAKILLCGWVQDDDPAMQQTDTANGEPLPESFIKDLFDPTVIKISHNAQFEKNILSAVLKRPMPASQWQCTAAMAAHAGLPRNLNSACTAAGLPGKFEHGAQFMRKFCIAGKPCEGEDWFAFRRYNLDDVDIERKLYHWLDSHYPMPELEWTYWRMDQEINDRGFRVDIPFVNAALKCLEIEREQLIAEAMKITGMDNPNSVQQLKRYLGLSGEDSLDKTMVKKLLETATGDKKRVLEIRQILGMSSVKKYATLSECVSSDGRCRGGLLYYGAHTGRWTGKLFQPQNLPRIKMEDIPFAKSLVLAEDLDSLKIFYGGVTSTLSGLLRSTIIAPENGYLRVDDYSAIEARITAWLAGESWILETFRNNLPYYEVTATKLFRVLLENVTEELRQKGKIASLALQYQGHLGAIRQMGIHQEEMSDEEAIDLVNAWRAACPNIVRYWGKLEEAALNAVRRKQTVALGVCEFSFDGKNMTIKLPSGRIMVFRNAAICESAHTGMPAIDCDVEYKGKIVRKQMYGGMYCENVTQGIARDLLADYMLACKDWVVLSVHDELVLENHGQVPLIAPKWAEGIPLAIAGFDSPFYKKE